MNRNTNIDNSNHKQHQQQQNAKWWMNRFETKLNVLTEISSKESYQALAKWFLFNRKWINEFIYILNEYFSKYTNNWNKQILYVTLIHEILCNDKNTTIHKWDRYTNIRILCGENGILACIDVMHTITLQKMLSEYTKIWDDNNVFDGPTILNQMKRKISSTLLERNKNKEKEKHDQQQHDERKLKQEQGEDNNITITDLSTKLTTSSRNDKEIYDVDHTTNHNNSNNNNTNTTSANNNNNSNNNNYTTTTNNGIKVKNENNVEEEPTIDVVLDKDKKLLSAIVVDEDVSSSRSSIAVITKNPMGTERTIADLESMSNEKDAILSHPTAPINSSDVRHVMEAAPPLPKTTTITTPMDDKQDQIIEGSHNENESPIRKDNDDDSFYHHNVDDDVDALLAGTNTSTTSTLTDPTNLALTTNNNLILLSSNATMKDGGTIIEYDFENMGIPYQKVDPKDLVEHCKTIATLQIARDLRNDGAVQLSSLLSSLPNDIQKLCENNSIDNDNIVLDDMTLRDYVHRVNQPDILLHMDLQEQLLNVQNFREIISRQQISRAKLMKQIIASRCSFGSNDSASAYYHITEEVSSLLHHRSQVLSDAMELEGFDMGDDDNNNNNGTGTKEPPNKKMKSELPPLTWYQPLKEMVGDKEG